VARKAIGLKVGDFVEATPTKGGIFLRPNLVVDGRPREADPRRCQHEHNRSGDIERVKGIAVWSWTDESKA
jgi:hypothetical protein